MREPVLEKRCLRVATRRRTASRGQWDAVDGWVEPAWGG
jgi:hypothetical protein